MFRGFQSVVLAALVSAVGVATASAADMPIKAPMKAAPVPYPTINWTGFYVGAGVGYSWGRVEVGTGGNPDAGGLKPSGFMALVNAGYDHQFANNVVVGARLAVPILGADDTTFSPTFGSSIRAETNFAIVLTGRVGVAIDRFLPYVFAGGVWARGEATSVGIATVEADHTGYILGVGFETMLAPHWSLDINYSYVNMSTEGYNFTPFGGAVVNYGYHASNVTATVNYRF